MSLGTDQQTEDAAHENEFVLIEIYRIELKDGRVLFLTRNNGNVEWNGDTYLAFPIDRDLSKQNDSNTIGDMQITLGDSGSMLTREVLNNLSLVINTFVTIYQQRESIDGAVMLGFRQIFRGRIKAMNGSLGIINFNIVAPFSDPQKPINDKKFGEFEGMINVFRRVPS